MNIWHTQHNDHDYFPRGKVEGFLRDPNTGVNNRGRHRLAEIIAEYPQPTVLDAACGTCVNWEVIRGRGVGCIYTGFDRTEQFLDYAEELYGQEISLVQGLVQEMPFEDDQFDVVILRHIVEHLGEGYEQAIKEGLRVASREMVLVLFEELTKEDDDDINLQEGEFGPFYWNRYSHSKFMKFLVSLGLQFKIEKVSSPHAVTDTIVRISK